jgi:hypothetical protein
VLQWRAHGERMPATLWDNWSGDLPPACP